MHQEAAPLGQRHRQVRVGRLHDRDDPAGRPAGLHDRGCHIVRCLAVRFTSHGQGRHGEPNRDDRTERRVGQSRP